MLPADDLGSSEPTLVLLHSLGSSRRQWAECVRVLSERHRCLSIDLPGHGAASRVAGYDVEAMQHAVRRTIDAHDADPAVLVGHSMSGKVAMAIAADQPERVAGLVLVSPSPPTPEPIAVADRRRMLAMGRNRACAEDFLDHATACPLDGDRRARAVDDFLICSPAAWVAWLECGSNEDWSERIGILDCPALVVVGEHDSAMPATMHHRLTMPHLSGGELQTLPGCGHLPPRECPQSLAGLIAGFVRRRVAADEER